MTDTSLTPSIATGTATVNWQVVAQREAVGQLPNGTYTDGVEITLAVGPNQDEVTTWVAKQNYSDTQLVAHRCQQAYDEWLAVSQLSG